MKNNCIIRISNQNGIQEELKFENQVDATNYFNSIQQIEELEKPKDSILLFGEIKKFNYSKAELLLLDDKNKEHTVQITYFDVKNKFKKRNY